MSSIIDDLIFYGKPKLQNEPKEAQQRQEALNFATFFKKIHLSQGAHILRSSADVFQQCRKIQLQDRSFSVRMKLELKKKRLSVQIKMLKDSFYYLLGSKQCQILFLKEIAKWQFTTNRQAVLYINGGSVTMQHQLNLTLNESLTQNKITDFFNLIFVKNMAQLNIFIDKHQTSTGHFSILQDDQEEKLERDLYLSQILNTTTTTFDVSEDFSQFKQFEASTQLKRKDLKHVKDNIINNQFMEATNNTLYCMFPERLKTTWVKNNFEHDYATNEKRFQRMLASAKWAGQKKIDDYTFNTVRATIVEPISRPISTGGSCNIHVAKAAITFISSLDSTAYFENEQKKEKMVAIKKLKTEMGKKYRYKLQHEKTIVSKLKGGCCYFLPKYYRMQDKLDPEDSLLMEYISGEQLDYFTLIRRETISLWTKICLLLHVVFGLRHLTSYKICHLDLKPLNVLVCKQLITKIIDFGQAYHPEACSQEYAPGYTFPYVAPQIFAKFEKNAQGQKNFQFSQKQDVFSFGVIMAEIIFNCRLFSFSQDKFKEIYRKKEVLDRYFFGSQKIEGFGDSKVILSLAYIIQRCLDPDPRERPKLDWIAVSLKLILNNSSG